MKYQDNPEQREDQNKEFANRILRPALANWKRWITAYLFHALLAFPVAMLIGFVFDIIIDRYYSAAVFRQLALCAIFVAAISGFLLASLRQQKAALFVWLPPLLLFVYMACSLAAAWDSTWVRVSRFQYVWNSLFGPNCTSQFIRFQRISFYRQSHTQ
jgi:hypothetical protein